jgi:hypothetical protein
MEQLGSHWTDFYEILHLIVFRKSAKKIQVSLFRMTNVSNKSCGKNQTTHFFSNFSFPKIVPCEKML